MARCSSCSADLPSGAKFCPECGSRLAPRVCPACGAEAPSGRFCAECGTPLEGIAVGTSEGSHPGAAIAERRVTSVLFGDLVGFTTLSEARDPEEVRELLSTYFSAARTIVGRYGGVVEKFIGDAVMAVWGVPTAHEDDAERAVRAGLELVAEIAAMGQEVGAPGLSMRVGVVTGEVAVTVGATGEGMVAGDAVNTAARVQSAADPGTVWVDETTRTLTAAAISYTDVGEHPLKGKAEPARLWCAGAVVAELGGGQRVDGLEAPLTGRDRELRLLKELFHATQESARPRLVVLDGEPGVGKSRLAWEFEKYVDGLTATVRWHRGRCLSYGDGVAFWALAEALRPRLGLAEADSGAVVTERVDAGLTELVSDGSERDWLRPRLAALLGATGSGPSGGFAREELFAAWTAFLEHVAADDSALVWVIDDAQYADDGLVAFIEHLLNTARAPIFVLALARPELLASRPGLGGRRASVIRLDPLDDAAMSQLLDGLVDGLGDSVRAALVTRAEGVPLFAVETVRALIDRDAVIPRGGRYVPAANVAIDLATIGAPASLQALVAARLDALAADERALVADASVLGASFTREGLLALGGDDETLDSLLTSLQRKEIISVQQDRFSAERGQFRFVQSVVRQVAYGTLSRRDRKTRHLAAADFLAGQSESTEDLAVVIAQHLLDAVDSAATTDPDVADLEQRACVLLERAGVRAQALGSPAEARRRFESALERVREPADQARLRLEAAKAAGDAGEYQAGSEHARVATELYDDLDRPIEAATAVGTRSRCLQILSDFDGIMAVAWPRWTALLDTRGAERALLSMAGPLAAAHVEHGDLEAASRLVDRRVLLAEALGEPEALVAALIGLGVRFQGIGGPATARALYEAAAGIARQHDLPAELAHARLNLGTVLMGRDLSAALDALSEAREVARRSGVAGFINYATGNYASALWIAGRLSEAADIVSQTKETTTTPTIQVGLATLETFLAEAMGLPLPDEIRVESAESSWDLAARGVLEVTRAMARGDVAAAVATSEEILQHALAAGGVEDDFMLLWPPLVRAALAAGDTALAGRLLQPAIDAPKGSISVAILGHIRNLRGLLGAARGEEPSQVEDDLRAGVSTFSEFGAVVWAARAEEDLGQWLTQQARPDEAASHLARVRQTYERIGAAGWLARLEDSLVTGADTVALR